MLQARLAKGKAWYQAELAWQILTAFVMFASGRTMTYDDLAQRMGFDSGKPERNLAEPLSLIGSACLETKLPPLNAIVVNQQGRPGSELVLRAGATFESTLDAIYAENWFRWRVPHANLFKDIVDARAIAEARSGRGAEG